MGRQHAYNTDGDDGGRSKYFATSGGARTHDRHGSVLTRMPTVMTRYDVVLLLSLMWRQGQQVGVYCTGRKLDQTNN